MKTFAVHPGEILDKEFLGPLNLTPYRLAKDLKVSVPRVNDIVRGKRSITADTAIRLGTYFNLSPQFWLNLQNRYDLSIAAKDKALKAVKPRSEDAA